jgi:hypothetical protein
VGGSTLELRLSFVIVVRFLVVEFHFALPDYLIDYVSQIPLFDGSAKMLAEHWYIDNFLNAIHILIDNGLDGILLFGS